MDEGPCTLCCPGAPGPSACQAQPRALAAPTDVILIQGGGSVYPAQVAGQAGSCLTAGWGRRREKTLLVPPCLESPGPDRQPPPSPAASSWIPALTPAPAMGPLGSRASGVFMKPADGWSQTSKQQSDAATAREARVAGPGAHVLPAQPQKAQTPGLGARLRGLTGSDMVREAQGRSPRHHVRALRALGCRDGRDFSQSPVVPT